MVMYLSRSSFSSMALNRRENKIEWNGEDQEREGPWCENTQRLCEVFQARCYVLFGGGACTEELAAIACIADFSFLLSVRDYCRLSADRG